MSTTSADSPLVSIIVPAYNGAERIGRTLESLIAQDYPNIEIVVVNDRSRDDTAAVVRRVLETGERKFQIIEHENNRGGAAARNTGLRAAKGDLVIFADQDDLHDTNYISMLANASAESGADITFTGWRSISEKDGPVEERPVKLSRPLDDPEGYVRAWFTRKFDSGIWCLMYRKDFLLANDLYFTEGCEGGVDIEYLVSSLLLSKKTTFVQGMPYIYILHASQTTAVDIKSDRSYELFKDDMNCHARIARFVRTHAKSDDVKKLAKYLYMPETLVKKFTVLSKRGDEKRFFELYERVRRHRTAKKLLLSSFRAFFSSPELAFKSFMVLYFPKLYYRMRSK